MAQTILVVDDDLDTLMLIGLTLQRRGFSVTKAQSGPEALEKLQTAMPDLMIVDVMMPYMDGYELCRTVKDDPRTAHLPVVMLTAKAQTASQLEGFRAGAVDYITKPCIRRPGGAHRCGFGARAGRAGGDRLQSHRYCWSKRGRRRDDISRQCGRRLAAQHRTLLIDLEASAQTPFSWAWCRSIA